MAHLSRKAELVHGRRGVAAADDGHGAGIGHGLRHGAGAFRQLGIFKHAHGAVPDHGLRRRDGFAEQLDGLRADVHAHAVRRDGGDVDHLGLHRRVDGFRERFGRHGVHGKQELLAQLLRLFDHVAAVVDLGLVQQGLADLIALRLDEGVGHAAADDQGIALLQQVGDDVQLVGDLGAAQDGDERTLGVVHGVAQEGDLLLHQVADGAVAAFGADEFGHADHGSVGAVRGTERIADEGIRQIGQFLAEAFAVLGLFGAPETGVLQQDHVAVLHGRDGFVGRSAGHVVIVHELHGLAQQFAQADRHGRQGFAGVRAVFDFAQVRT